MTKLHKEAAHHLDEDIKGYKKERKFLKKEIAEDKALKRKLVGKKNGRKKR